MQLMLNLLLMAAATVDTPVTSPPGFFRHPALRGDALVFAAEGDLWRVDVAGGRAWRLTSHPGEESHPRLSPDGTQVAYTARYEGPAEVYTMPIDGGLPTRRTWEAEASIASSWTPAGELVYATAAESMLPDLQLVALGAAPGARRVLPLSQASEGSFDVSGRTLFFVRPAFHNNVTRRYTGGTARRVWRFSEADEEAVCLTPEYAGESHSPLWWQGRVYFVSDRHGTMNVWSMDESGAGLRQHTRHAGWDIRRPALDAGRLVYELGADLRLLDLGSGEDHLIPIELVSDFDQLREKWVKEPLQYLTAARIHPEGESAVLTARGRVFVVPVGPGRLARAVHDEGVRYRDALFAADGGRVLALSDATGELEWVSLPADGVGESRSLTSDGSILRFGGVPSPDGARLAYTDKNEDLWILDLASGEQTRVSTNREGGGEPRWSPDGRWLAFVQRASNTFARIHLHDTRDGTTSALTSDRVNSRAPAFAPDGRFLYFLSDRDLRSLVRGVWGPRQPEPHFDAPYRVYEVALQSGLRSPFQPPDELQPRPDEAPAAEDEPGAPEAVETAIELEGLQGRVRELTIEPGNYSSLAVAKGALFLLAHEAGRRGESHLLGVKVGGEKPEPVKILDKVLDFELAAKAGHLLVRRQKELLVLEAAPKAPRREGAPEGTAGPVRMALQHRPARGLAPDLRRRLAHGARLLLRPRHARRRLGGGARQVPPPRRAGDHSRRAERPDRPGGGGAFRAPHERPGRGPPGRARRREARQPRGAPGARRGGRGPPHRSPLPQRSRLPLAARASGGAGCGHRRGRRDRRDQRGRDSLGSAPGVAAARPAGPPGPPLDVVSRRRRGERADRGGRSPTRPTCATRTGSTAAASRWSGAARGSSATCTCAP